MARLVDLEELLLKVKNKELLPSLREAVACYHVASYRACIMLSFNALVDDLLIKLKNLKDINVGAKKIYDNINILIEGQSSFETPLIEQLVKAKIFTDLEGDLYKTFQKFRHKSAHPSGYSPSAECARFIYTEVIEHFLSKETLLASDRIDTLISDINEDLFFTSTRNKERAKIAKDEIGNIYPEAYPQMINKIYNKATLSGEDISNRYISFLCALFGIKDNLIDDLIIKIIIKKNISKGKHSFLFTSLISCNPSAFNDIDKTSSEKLIANLNERIKKAPKNIGNYQLSNPYYCYLKVCNEGKGYLKDGIINSLSVFLDNIERLPFFLSRLDKSTSSIGFPAYKKIRKIIFDIVYSDNREQIDKLLNVLLEDESECMQGFSDWSIFEICCAIIMNKSKSDIAAKICTDKFEQLSYLIDKASDHYSNKNFSISSLFNKMTEKQKSTLDSIFNQA